MQRVAFCLRLKPGAAEGYDKSHREVWPEMLALLKRAGISEYSIFRRGELSSSPCAWMTLTRPGT